MQVFANTIMMPSGVSLVSILFASSWFARCRVCAFLFILFLGPFPLPAQDSDRVTGLIYYSVENLDEGAIEQSGIAGSAGVAFDNLILAPNTRYRVWLLEAATLRVAEVEITTPDPGFRFTFPDFLFRTASAHDADGDGLHDLGESILGTDGLDPDSDNDGILDGPEVRQGLDPVSGLAVRTGLIGSVDTVGDALDVCAANDIAVVALGSLGVRVFNIFNGMNPVLIASVDTPGDARAVAASGSRIAVADGPAGLAVIDISDPPAASIVHRVNLGASTRAVAVAGDVAFVGLDSGEVVSVDLGSGIILDRLQLDAIPEDLGVGGEHLYAWTDGVLYTLSFQEGELAVVDTLAATGGIGPGGRRLRLFVGSDLAYGIYKSGYSIFDLTDSAHPTLNQTVATGQLGWKQIVANGSGLGVAAVSPNATDDGTHHVSLFNVGADGTGSDFVTEFETPGLAAAVTIYNGIAYIADSEGGFAGAELPRL